MLLWLRNILTRRMAVSDRGGRGRMRATGLVRSLAFMLMVVPPTIAINLLIISPPYKVVRFLSKLGWPGWPAPWDEIIFLHAQLAIVVSLVSAVTVSIFLLVVLNPDEDLARVKQEAICINRVSLAVCWFWQITSGFLIDVSDANLARAMVVIYAVYALGYTECFGAFVGLSSSEHRGAWAGTFVICSCLALLPVVLTYTSGWLLHTTFLTAVVLLAFTVKFANESMRKTAAS